MLGMDAAMQEDMATYVTKIRPAFTNPGVPQLFVKDDGDAFPEGTIGKRVTAFFQKSGVTSTRVGHTHLRKFIATQTHKQGTQDEGHTLRGLCPMAQQQSNAATFVPTLQQRPPRP